MLPTKLLLKRQSYFEHYHMKVAIAAPPAVTPAPTPIPTVDYRSHQTTYHLSNDETLILQMGPSEQGIEGTFSAAGVQAAIRGAQQGTVMYPEFKHLSMQAGCIGYTVWIAGRHVAYYGRKGETHVEHFPA